MIRRLVVVCGVAAVALAGCGSDAADRSGGTTVESSAIVTVTGSGPVSLRVGQQLDVTLESNPTTGYDWLIDAAPDAAVIEQAGEPSYQPAPVASNVVGSGGTTTFRFDARAAGTTTVVLRYKRSWEDDTADDQLVTVDVTVTAG